MRGNKSVAAWGLIVAASASPAGAATVEEVIAKHVAAKGGDGWQKIESLKISGSCAAFSQVSACTLHRARGNKLHLAMELLGSEFVTGYDGETAWQDSGEGAEPVGGLERAILLREADFVTPLFDWQARGYLVELLGEVDFEGRQAIGIRLDRRDGSQEVWYLDPRTFLELGRVSPGNDWLGPVERRTYYDDFREVGGLRLPFRVESQWYTRERVFEVASVETNVAVDAALFGMPPPKGMGPLASLAGSWQVALDTRQHPGAEWESVARESRIEARLRGGLLEERFATAQGVEVVRTLSYDRFGKKYRVTQIDGQRTQLDVKHGDFDGNGRLVVTNVDTGTTWSGFGMTFHGRLALFDITPDGFKVEQESSSDGGATWFLNAKATYTRNLAP